MATIWSHTEKCQFPALWKVLHFWSHVNGASTNYICCIGSSMLGHVDWLFQWTAYTTLLSLCKGVLSLGWTIIFYGCWWAWSALECYICREIFQHSCHMCGDNIPSVLFLTGCLRSFYRFLFWHDEGPLWIVRSDSKDSCDGRMGQGLSGSPPLEVTSPGIHQVFFCFVFFFKWRSLSDERQNVFKHFNPFFCTNLMYSV